MLWTVEQYDPVIETGVVPEDASVEFLDRFMVRKDRAKAGENPMTVGDRYRIAVLRLAHSAPLFEPLGCFLARWSGAESMMTWTIPR